MSTAQTIYCTGCREDVCARLTNGKEIYPHRTDLYELPFWKCDTCNNYVGCHHKTFNRTKPLGYIATPEIANARKKIHALLDPIWKTNRMRRRHLYAQIGEQLGYQYHSAEIREISEARKIYKIVAEINNNLLNN